MAQRIRENRKKVTTTSLDKEVFSFYIHSFFDKRGIVESGISAPIFIEIETPFSTRTVESGYSTDADVRSAIEGRVLR
jgi:hypothetical protein